jgi:hypothetical protein
MRGLARKEGGRRAPLAPSVFHVRLLRRRKASRLVWWMKKLKFILKSFDSATVARRLMEDLDRTPNDKTSESHVFKAF